jgi:hypothetical protein
LTRLRLELEQVEDPELRARLIARAFEPLVRGPATVTRAAP